jgi:hypothetical protein
MDPGRPSLPKRSRILAGNIQIFSESADWEYVRPHVSFSDVLDETLAGFPIDDTPPAAPRTYLPPTLGFFPFEARKPRRIRILSPRQESALGAFVRLGARIGRNFTEAELRSAFRMLAREYHPDRHPHSSDAEKSRLSAAFAQLTDAYEHLQTAAPAAAS